MRARLSRISIGKALAGAALGTGLAASRADSAGLVYDLRFVDGEHSKLAVPGTSYGLELWGIVSGTNGTQTDDGIISSYLVVASQQQAGGALLDGGLITAALDPTPGAGFNGGGSRAGAPNDINGDGVSDWGTTATNLMNTNYMFARSNTADSVANGGGADGGQAVDPNTWAFRMASFTLYVNNVGPGITSFNVVKPNAVNNGISPGTYASARVDGINYGVTNANAAATGTYANSTGVQFIVPEPASVGLVGAAAVGLLGRRRRN